MTVLIFFGIWLKIFVSRFSIGFLLLRVFAMVLHLWRGSNGEKGCGWGFERGGGRIGLG
jgi:hypothetical protein